jgi:hypothetical protein
MITFSQAAAVMLTFVGGTSQTGDVITADQFLRFVKSQQSSIRDVAFAFEGEGEYIGPAKQVEAPPLKYQGRYALRSDGATFLEYYFEYGDGRPDQHDVRAMLGGAGERARVSSAYFADPNSPVLKMASGPGSFFGPQSPETFQFLWRFQTLKGVSDFGYKFVGWEDVDGHRCAHIEFNAHPLVAGRVLQELWLDLERGAHPLRIRNSDRGETVYLIDQISLGQFMLPSGEKAWFPIGGRFNRFHHEGKYTRDPTYRATTYILKDTLIFNQGLGDGVFRVKGEPFRPTFQPRPSMLAGGPKRNPAVDFADVDKKLDASLAEPSRQGLAQDASASTRGEASSGVIVAWGLGLCGAAALLVAGFLVLRRRC